MVCPSASGEGEGGARLEQGADDVDEAVLVDVELGVYAPPGGEGDGARRSQGGGEEPSASLQPLILDSQLAVALAVADGADAECVLELPGGDDLRSGGGGTAQRLGRG